MNELLLVTENRAGTCEHNFVSTFEEFAHSYMKKEDRDTVDRFGILVDRTAGNTEVWSTYYQGSGVILDVRACASQEDLDDFLSGKFNDSCEKIEARLPGCSHAKDWRWQNDMNQFSPRALDIIRRECPESLRCAAKQIGRKTPLSERISLAAAQQKTSLQIDRDTRFDRCK